MESAKEKLVSIPYKGGSWVYQAAKLMLFSQSSGMYACPLSMTDGAAFTIKALVKEGF